MALSHRPCVVLISLLPQGCSQEAKVLLIVFVCQSLIQPNEVRKPQSSSTVVAVNLHEELHELLNLVVFEVIHGKFEEFDDLFPPHGTLRLGLAHEDLTEALQLSFAHVVLLDQLCLTLNILLLSFTLSTSDQVKEGLEVHLAFPPLLNLFDKVACLFALPLRSGIPWEGVHYNLGEPAIRNNSQALCIILAECLTEIQNFLLREACLTFHQALVKSAELAADALEALEADGLLLGKLQ
mmetsp:Transcript_42415/g.76151  ORF Transcript_42415/g.76151 Transcript_42415/m.76151 type:complete len:239 (-) Transcript_42415:3090-3806(-)